MDEVEGPQSSCEPKPSPEDEDEDEEDEEARAPARLPASLPTPRPRPRIARSTLPLIPLDEEDVVPHPTMFVFIPIAVVVDMVWLFILSNKTRWIERSSKLPSFLRRTIDDEDGVSFTRL